MATISHIIFCKTKNQANASVNKKITEIVRIHKKAFDTRKTLFFQVETR